MTTITLTDAQVELLNASMAQARAYWCKQSVDALIGGNENEPTYTSIYAKTVELDELIKEQIK